MFKELEILREAWPLADALRNITNAEASLKNRELQLVAVHLGVAKWNVEQVKHCHSLNGRTPLALHSQSEDT